MYKKKILTIFALCLTFICLVFVNMFILKDQSTDEIQYADNSSNLGEKTSGFLGQVVIDLNDEITKQNDYFEEIVQQYAQINSDVIGWLFIKEFKISYPVLYSEDNKKYLRANMYGEYDISGEIYMDANYGDPLSPVKLIHGHNMKDGTKFSPLVQMIKWDTLDGAPIIYYYDSSGLKSYKIVAILSVDSTQESVIVDPYSSIEQLESCKEDYLNKSIVPVTDVPSGTEMLLLNTCWYGKTGVEHNLHCIVVSVRI